MSGPSRKPTAIRIAADGELSQRSGAVQLSLDECAEALVGAVVVGRQVLRAQIGVLVVHQLRGELASVSREEAPSLHG